MKSARAVQVRADNDLNQCFSEAELKVHTRADQVFSQADADGNCDTAEDMKLAVHVIETVMRHRE
jgi:hypothetical protein